jgi:hypothetical protein
MLLDRGATGGLSSLIRLETVLDSDGRLGLNGGGPPTLLLSLRNGNVLDLLSWLICEGCVVSFCKRSKNASIPSAEVSFLLGGGGGGGSIAPAPVTPGLGRAGRPTLPLEKVELRDLFEATEVRCAGPAPLLFVLPCVAVLL